MYILLDLNNIDRNHFIFSCDQAVRLAVRPSICHTFLAATKQL